MKFSQFVNHVGDENIKLQRLDRCFTKASTNRKGETTVTFKTAMIHANELAYDGEKADHIGFVVWVPKNKLIPGDSAPAIISK